MRFVDGKERLETLVLDFGTTASALRVIKSVLIENSGHGTATLSVRAPGAPFEFAGEPVVTLEPGRRVKWTLTYAPPFSGEHAQPLVIDVQNGDLAELRAELRGRAVPWGPGDPSCLMIGPLEFPGAIATCSSSAASVRVSSFCYQPVVLTDIRLFGEGFSLRSRPSLPMPLQSADPAGLPLELTFTPTREGLHEGELILAVGDRLRRIPLTATATEPAAVRHDVFPRVPTPKVDLLLVVDDSPSFASKRAEVEEQLRHFARYLRSLYFDVHVGVTTTSVCRKPEACSPEESDWANGRLLPVDGSGPRVLKPEQPDFEEQLAARLDVIGGGSERERLVKPAILALTEPLRGEGNAGFLREDARLAIIVISDAADADDTGVTQLYASLLDIKGVRRSSDFSISAIVPGMPVAPAGCAYDEPEAGSSGRVRDLVLKTGGIYDDICSRDWSKALEHLGSRAFRYSNPVLHLTRTPWKPDETLRLEMGGAPLAPIGPTGDLRWTYDAYRNAIEVEPLVYDGTLESVASYVACE